MQNAVEASSGKMLEILIDENEFSDCQLMSGQYVPAGKYARIDIYDSGIGISEVSSLRPLVILDLSDQNSESAVETCLLSHEIDPDLKVIAMSGSILDPIMDDYRDYGFVNTIPKPFSVDSLKHISNTVLHT